MKSALLLIVLSFLSTQAFADDKAEEQAAAAAVKNFIYVINQNSAGINTVKKWNKLKKKVSEVSSEEVANKLLNSETAASFNASLFRVMAISGSIMNMEFSSPQILESTELGTNTVYKVISSEDNKSIIYDVTCDKFCKVTDFNLN